MSARLLIPLMGCLYIGNAVAQSKAETWRCKAGVLWEAAGAVVVVATHDDGGFGLGEVQVAGVTQVAHYSVQGFDRRWDFGALEKDGSYPFSFVIHPDGSAAYYDFSTSADGNAKASQLYTCKSR